MTAVTPGPPPRDHGQATPGQAAYDEACDQLNRAGALLSLLGAYDPEDVILSWAQLNDSEREAFEVIAQAANDAATEGALRACGYTLADIARFLEAEAADPAAPQPAVGTDAPDSSVEALEKTLAAATAGEGVTVVTVRGVEALRTWHPADAAPTLQRLLNEARADRDDYASRLKAVDQSWAKLAAERDRLRALLDHETRLTWDEGLPGERARVTPVREQAGLPPLDETERN